MSKELVFFSAFVVFVISMLAIDLGIFNKKNHVVKVKEAAIFSAVWVGLALAFFFFIRIEGHLLHDVRDMARLQQIVEANKHPVKLIARDYGQSLDIYKENLSVEFITGYVVEYALSVDNIFVIVLIFTAFNVEEKYYHRVLFWGIVGAVIMRFAFIFLGATLISRFEWILYLFGAFLVFTGIRMFFQKDEEEKIDTKNHPVIKFASKYFAIYPEYVRGQFFVKKHNKKMLTPLFLVLLIIEFTDLIFAVDSIPAIFSITKDPYIVFFSNIFAILGLRSMFFLLVNIIHKFHYLKTGLSVLLTFIGVKMLAHGWLERLGFGTVESLIVIVGILAVSIGASLMFPKKEV